MITFPKISIIIPVWGVEQYIRDCIRSVFAQDYTGELECILVNDCTLDKSMDVINQELKGYKGKIEFQVLSHEKNRGLSAARNTGMEKATGNYLFFLDSDDEIVPNCISSLATPLTFKSYDMVVGDIKAQNTEQETQWLSLQDGEITSPQEVRATYLARKWYPMAVNKLYKKTFLRKFSLSFMENLVHEDELWSAQIAFLLETMYVVQRKTYLYKIRPNSIMTGIEVQKDLEAYCNVVKKLQDFYKRCELSNDVIANKLLLRNFEYIMQIQRERCLPFNNVYEQARCVLMIDKYTVFLQSGEGILWRLIHSHLLLPPIIGKYHYLFVRFFVKRGIIIKGYLCGRKGTR